MLMKDLGIKVGQEKDNFCVYYGVKELKIFFTKKN